MAHSVVVDDKDGGDRKKNKQIKNPGAQKLTYLHI